MKKQLLALGSLLLVTGLPVFVSADEVQPDSLLAFTAKPHIARGMDRETVRTMLGEPSAQLSADVWVYFDFKVAKAVITHPGTGPVGNRNSLVVGFSHDRVSVIRACDSAPVRALLAAQGGKKPAAPVIAAK